MAVLRSMCELPCLVHYLNSNKERFDLTDIDTEILENSLLSAEDVFVSDLFARILRHILQNSAIRIATFESHLVELLGSRGATWNPLTNTEYKALSPHDKLKLLKWLTDQTKDKKSGINEFLEDLQSDADSQESRIINIGQDSENRTYWYLDDLRLYRSKTANPTKDSGDWKCVAITLEEWQSLIQDLEKSSNAQEKDLYTYLNEQLFKPTIKPVLENKASGSVTLIKKPTDDEIQAKEDADIIKMQAANTTDPKANPELTKVLNEEPKSANTNKDHNDKGREEHPRKLADERKAEFTKTASNHGGGVKTSQENVSQSSQHHGLKVSQQMSPHSIALPAKMAAPYPAMNGSNGSYPPPSSMPNYPGWNGQRPPMSSYNNVRPESPGMWGPAGLANASRLDISHHIVPDESLTPEQRQNRQAGMESLRKLHEMLSANEQDRQMQQMTDFSHISMAQDAQGPPGGMAGPPMHPSPADEFGVYGPCPPHLAPGGAGMLPNGPPMGPGGPPMGPGQQMMPSGHQMAGGPPMGPGGPPGMPPGGHMMGAGGQPMGPGMMAPPGHHHHHPMGSPMAPGPMPPGHPHMNPGGPMPPQMTGGPHMDMGMYPGPHSKPPPPYQAPMPAAPDAPAPRTSKAKKRKGSTQSPAPQSPMGQSLKSPKYPIPPSPLAAPGPMPAGFPMPEQGGPPGPHSQMFKGPHGPIPPHSSQQGNLMQAGPPEPFQGHPSSGTNSSHKPPPSYSQSTNKRTALESITAPSPQKQYYSQFENQELTIIKQPNTAYQSTDLSDPNQFPSQASRAPTTPGSPMNSRSNVTNITSASLANLAKGVEQIQQTMVEGGPFRDLQQPGQQPGQPAVGGGAPNSMSAAGQPAANSIPASSGGPQSSQPSVNNTFVNAHMSIGQVNIQNVNASQQHASFDAAGRPAQMQQNVDVTMNTGSMTPGTPRFASDEPAFSAPNPATSSASVKVQAKGASTLQYLPVSQKPSLPAAEPAVPSKQHPFDFPRNEHFPQPLPGMDAKAAASKMNYYPDNSRLPPPPPQRLPHSVNSTVPLTSQAGNAPGMPQYSAAQGPHPSMTMHPSPAPHMSPGVPPSHHHPQFPNGHHGMMPPVSSMYSPPAAPYAPIGAHAGPEGLPSNMAMMEGMHPSHPVPPQMMSHGPQPSMPPHPSMMSQPQSPFGPQGPMEFGSAPHGAHSGFPGEFPPGGPGFPNSLARQMSHPGPPGMPPQHMMMSPQGGPYMGSANGPGPYMMGR